MALSSPSKNANHQQQLEKQQKTKSRLAVWFKTVFLQRKEYVPGDTYRFVWQKVPEIQGVFVIYRIIHMICNLLVFFFSFLHISQPVRKDLCAQKFILCGSNTVRLQFEWFFYATSVGIMVNLTQAVWGMVLTLRMYHRQTRATNAKDVESRGEIDRSGHKKVKTDREANPVSIAAASESSQNTAQDTKDDDTVVNSTPSTVPVDSAKKGETKNRGLMDHIRRPVSPHAKEDQARSPARAKCGTGEHNAFSKTGIYWGLHSYSLCASVIIDIVYWTLIWPGLSTFPNLFFIQFDEHFLNLLLMVTDYVVVAFPITPSHICYTAGISTMYAFVNVTYFLAGGLNHNRTKHYLYSFLDWTKPGKAIAYSVGVILSLSLFHCLLLLADHYKFKLRPRNLFDAAQQNPRTL